ncbi:MAG: outer-membrane lipoprotein carrier protein LolA [Beijerinckiaceae bacterium]|nr:outer-membrane lipoprotein carrier protein LolA [Beijerinckiaceae bacterium]
MGLTAQLAAAQAAPSPSDYVTITGAEADKAISKADSFLSSAQTMVGDFEQKGQDGRVSQGKIYIQKPGKLRFEYAAPAALEVIADGSNVAVNDRRMKTQNTYSIGQTPLKFLLEDKIDLKADTQILNVLKTPDAVMILLDDRTTFGGTSRIRLIFDKDTYELRAWQVRDPQGYETLVTLYNIDLAMKPDPKLFKISALDQSKN